MDDRRRTSLRHHLDRQRRRRAFAAQLPLTLDMSELNGNEKHADLPKPLPANASRPGTIRNGDLMLYGADTLVVFYLTFQSSLPYTRLGRVDDPSTWHRRSGRAVFESYFPRTSFPNDAGSVSFSIEATWWANGAVGQQGGPS